MWVSGRRLGPIAILVIGFLFAPVLNNDDESAYTMAGVPARPVQPKFQIDWLRGQLRLTGHTLSDAHEQDLLQAAATSFPHQEVIADFVPLGMVPSFWEDTTLQIIYALARTSSASASLTPEQLEIRGITVDEIDWRSHFTASRSTLPAEISLVAHTFVVSKDLDTRLACQHAFDSFRSGRINFGESNAALRSSAYPRLDRVIAIANACRESVVTITGHSDSSGNVSWNQQLSLSRANAVANYIVTRGIDRARLRVRGAGPTQPVADNSTRHGRELNRRIEIELQTH